MKPLTKYPFIKATECIKSLWLNQFYPQLKAEPSDDDVAVMEQGKQVGLLAQQLFSGGLDLSQGGMVYGKELIKATKAALQTDQQIFYEAAFETLDGSANFKADIFVVAEKYTKLIEVKSSTYIHDEYILDLAFQYYVLKNSDYARQKIEVFIAYINNEYVREEDIDVDELFKVENITQRIIDAQELIKNYLYQFKPILSEGSECPKVKVSKACTSPNTCSFYSFCWKDEPKNHILNISRISTQKVNELLEEGVSDMSEVGSHKKLTENQWIEVNAVKTGKPRIEKKKLQEFVTSINIDKPTLWMDFESFQTPIPQYVGTRAYQQICFQYCVIRRDSNGNMERREYLAEPGIDPRKEFLINLLKHTGGIEPIIVFNQKFEIARLNELAKDFSEFEENIQQVVERIVDLWVPFAKKYYYHPAMNCSASLKDVLPCFVSPEEYSYKKLLIQNGTMAMNAYKNLPTMPLDQQILTKRGLIDYCHLDVLGMVKIAEGLVSLMEQ